jgi:hypothetical protein
MFPDIQLLHEVNIIDLFERMCYMMIKKLKINENPNSRVKSALFGVKSGKIRTFAVLSAENPMGKQWSASENNKNTRELKNKLKQMHIQYVPIEGKYGNIEHSFMLFNITRSDAQYLAEWFEQESFFYGINTSPATLIYYETSSSDPTKYRKVEENNRITNEYEADDFFSRHGDFKFKFDLDYFRESIDRICESIINEYELNISLEEDRTIKSRIIHRLNSRRQCISI